jgi:hypothetical protein
LQAQLGTPEFTAPEWWPVAAWQRLHPDPQADGSGGAAGRSSNGVVARFAHTCAALLIAQGLHPKTIEHRLGHLSITAALYRYGHLFPRWITR